MAAEFPARIVCLSDETTETLYLLKQQHRIVGVSGFSTRPPEVRSKPRVSTFNSANVEEIVALNPDLVLTFSDVQAEITRQLVQRGLTVFNFNQRTVAGIFDMIRTLARIAGVEADGIALVESLQRGIDAVVASAALFAHRPRVYFEEWHDPLISGIGWVDELIEVAGGDSIFSELRTQGKAQDRVIDPAEVVRRDPEVIFASWCGMKADLKAIASRPGWGQVSAVRSGHLYEIPSSIILQPGPAALTDGLRLLHEHLGNVARANAARTLL
ncbi:cobalamin-binding protein [Acidobacteria bacterium AB60]|nr:cobalamin-binding protein [Acidobacteria bacterium AB60]